jgi:hypothetical protein
MNQFSLSYLHVGELAPLGNREMAGKKTVAGTQEAKMGPTIWLSGSDHVRSPSAQVKAAVAHVRRLNRNRRKGKLILSLGVLAS